MARRASPISQTLLRVTDALGWLVSAAFAGYLIVRLFGLINRYSVNLLFWDNFDYYFLLARPWNFRQRFTAQIGPHREGVGLLLSSLIAPLSRWNMRAEAFAIGIILVGAMFLCLWMKKRAFGQLACYDLVVFSCFFLTPKQFEIWSYTVNSSHGALPLLLIVLWCFGWTIQNRPRRDMFVLGINFLAVFTGFGLFLGVVTVCAFGVARNWRGAIAGMATLLLFFLGYTFSPANPHFRFFDPAIVKLPYAIALGLSHVFNVVESPWNQLCGYWLLAMFVVALAVHIRGFTKGEVRSVIVVSLIGYTIVFMLAAVEGRISFGAIFLTWSRYIPLLLPGFIGAYLSINRLRPSLLKSILFVIALGIALKMSAVVSPDDLSMMENLRATKVAWINTYLSTGSIEKADHAGLLPIYPEPQPSDFAGKIEYLRANRLNFFDQPMSDHADSHTR